MSYFQFNSIISKQCKHTARIPTAAHTIFSSHYSLIRVQTFNH